jgi:hypothetical protein
MNTYCVNVDTMSRDFNKLYWLHECDYGDNVATKGQSVYGIIIDKTIQDIHIIDIGG